jgi:hypothetical protein
MLRDMRTLAVTIIAMLMLSILMDCPPFTLLRNFIDGHTTCQKDISTDMYFCK